MKTAIIIGAGPAGLTAALELLRRTDIRPIVLEMSAAVGGLARTVIHQGNRIDIGGHRFFSKSERVIRWWREILPWQGIHSIDNHLLSQAVSLLRSRDGPDPGQTDEVMLLRRRWSRILFEQRFFNYPLSLDAMALLRLGLPRVARIGASYLRSRIHRIHPETSLQDLFINRFGKELYGIFFRDYTEKVWGVPPQELSAEWGRQRIRSVSLSRAILGGLRQRLSHKPSVSLAERSLAQWFLYPKLGPGQFWEKTAESVRDKGGRVELHYRVVHLCQRGDAVVEVGVQDQETGERMRVPADYVFSTMPVRNLVQALDEAVPRGIQDAAKGLAYRDLITVAVLLKRLRVAGRWWNPSAGNQVRDNWIYIHERGVKLGRLQIYNNWSPYMVHEAGTVFIGMEYFCTVGDPLWKQRDDCLAGSAIQELAQLKMIEKGDVLDWTVVRTSPAYPVHLGTSCPLSTATQHLATIGNLFLIGRHGTHRYHNIDHSMLTAMLAVDNVVSGRKDKSNIWDVNTEASYHESYN